MNLQYARKERNISAQDWVDAARKILIEKGIRGVSLRVLAKSLDATTGAFYWQHKNLEELLEAVRADWVSKSTDPFTYAVEAAGADGWQQYLAYTRVLVFEDEFDPRYDNAIRDWAHSCARTADVQRNTEQFKIKLLGGVFEAIGFDGKAAVIRARVTHYHQTGYNAMQIHESLEQRLENIPYYAEILTDRSDLFPDPSIEAIKQQLLETSR